MMALLRFFAGQIKGKKISTVSSLSSVITLRQIQALIPRTSCRHIQVKKEYSASTSELKAQITTATDNIVLKDFYTEG